MRAGEVVGSVRVQNRSVVLDFVDRLFHQTGCQKIVATPQQAALDEVGVPAVKLVEASAGNHIGAGEIKQPVVADLLELERKNPQLDAGEGEVANGRPKLLLDGRGVLTAGKVDIEPAVRPGAIDLGVLGGDDEVVVIAGKGLPRGINVGAELCLRLFIRICRLVAHGVVG